MSLTRGIKRTTYIQEALQELRLQLELFIIRIFIVLEE